MSAKNDLQAIEGKHFLEGKLLIALPSISDPCFEQTVIYICAHSLETGAMGLIINKPIDELDFHDLIRKLGVGHASGPNLPVLYGGPVETDRGFVLHGSDYQADISTVPISSSISLTATAGILSDLAAGCGPKHALFALGYAGWDAGQVEGEIRQNGWLHCDADQDILFEIPCEEKWKTAVCKMGIDISGLSAHVGRA